MDGTEWWDALRTDIDQRLQAPDTETLLARAEQRRRQRSSRTAGIAVLLVVVLAIPLLSSRLSHQVGPLVPAVLGPSLPTAASGPKTSVPGTPSAPSTPSTPNTPTGAGPSSVSATEVDTSRPERSVYSVEFADATHGFALIARCPHRRLPCSYGVSATEDGRVWTERAVPVDPTTSDVQITPSLVVLSRNRLQVEYSGLDVPVLVSVDAGRTWLKRDDPAPEPTASLPSGSTLTLSCEGSYEGCTSKFTVRDAGSGNRLTLTTAPHLWPIDLTQASATTWFLVAAKNFPEFTPRFARSTNSGKTWSVVALPSTGRRIYWVSLSRAGTAWYATVIGDIADTKNGLLAIDRSTDGGRTWTAVWKESGGKAPLSTMGTPVITADGSITVSTESGDCFSMPAGGSVFKKVGCRYTGWTSWEDGRYLASTSSGSYLLSTDGLHWTALSP